MQKPIYYLTTDGEKVEMHFQIRSICSGQKYSPETVKYKIGKKDWETASLRSFNGMALRNKWVSIVEKDIKDFGL